MFNRGELMQAKSNAWFSRFEYVVTLEGVVEPSGNTTQVRRFYLKNLNSIYQTLLRPVLPIYLKRLYGDITLKIVFTMTRRR